MKIIDYNNRIVKTKMSVSNYLTVQKTERER